MNPKVDFYFQKAKKWQEELEKLRALVLDCGLEEELKWGCPCYTLNKRNIVLIHDFKEYCALLFFKGALLSNQHGILIQQTENVQSARQARFTGVREIADMEPVIKATVYEAIEVEKAGLRVTLKQPAEFDIADEFRIKLESDETLKKAFGALTPGRQRAYYLHFSQPSQSKTREARVNKCIPLILDGKGLND